MAGMKTNRLTQHCLLGLTLALSACSAPPSSEQGSVQQTNAPTPATDGSQLKFSDPRGTDVKKLELDHLLDLANQGDSHAQIQIAWLYRDDDSLEKHDEIALQWFLKAASTGDSIAQDNVGIMYRDGIGADKDPAEAVKWFEKAAIAGNAEAQGNLGHMYFDGQGVSQDNVMGYAWSSLAVKNGNSTWAKTNLDLAKKIMKPEQIAAADKSIEQWKIGQPLSIK